MFRGGAELEGMSGGPTANRYGYTGMVHGSRLHKKDLVSLACVILFPIILARYINKFLNNHTLSSLLKSPRDCPFVKVITWLL